MIRKVSCVLTVLTLSVSLFALVLTVLPANVGATTLYVGGVGPGNYTTIQDAVDSAIAGSTVYVYSGTYYEKVNISKMLTLVGEDTNNTIVHGDGTSPTFYITADWVNVSYFTATADVFTSSYGAFMIEYADNCLVANNTVIDSNSGIRIRYSDNTHVFNNIVAHNGMGIYFSYSNHTEIMSNNVSSNTWDAIRSDFSWHARIVGNSAFFNKYKVIYSVYSTGILIEGNLASWNEGYGISIFETVDSRVIDNIISHNDNGIWSSFCDRGWIENNTIEHNNGSGINTLGISNITISNNTIDGGKYGIKLTNTENITVSNNSLNDTKRAIIVNGGMGQKLTGNSMVGGGVYAYQGWDFWGTVVIESNTVNGKPLLFWRNVTGATVPLDVGQIILTNCTNVIVQNQDINNTSIGIHLIYVSNSSVRDNKVEGSYTGIHIHESENVSIERNYVTSNEEDGIHLHYSKYNSVHDNMAWNTHQGITLSNIDFNTISNNTVSMNDEYGIMLDYSRQNTLTDNTAERNGIGIWVYRSSHNTIVNNNISRNDGYGMLLNWSRDNLIYNNDFIDNTIQAYADPDRWYSNAWDDGYPSGGNYWSDYSGPDNMSGPDQDQLGRDGIGDMPYMIWAIQDTDNYPLMNPFGASYKYPPSPPIFRYAIPGVEEITIAWSPPAFNGHSPITVYRIYRGTSLWNMTFLVQVHTVSHYTDTNLTAGQTYYYSITAVNSEGEGYASTEVAAAPMAPPVEPRDPEINWALIAAAVAAYVVFIALIIYAMIRIMKGDSEDMEPSEPPPEERNEEASDREEGG